MDVDSEKKDDKEKMDVDDKKEEEKEKKEVPEKKEPEPLFELLSNPARIMKAQLKVIQLEDGKSLPSLVHLEMVECHPSPPRPVQAHEGPVHRRHHPARQHLRGG